MPAAVGTVRWSDQLLLVDGVVAQALGALSTALLAVLLVRASISTRAAPLRIVVTVGGGFSLLLAMTSSGGVRTPDAVLFAGSAACAVTCLVVAATGARRLPELALALASLAGLVRLAAVHLTLDGSVKAGAIATLGFTLEVAVLGVVAAFLVRARVRGWVALGLAVVFGSGAAWLVIVQPESPLGVLARHAVENLAPRPHPVGPAVVAPAFASAGLALAVGLCLARRAERSVVGALAIVVLVRAHAEVPLLGMAMTIAAVALFLARAPASLRPLAQVAAQGGNSPRPDAAAAGDRLAPRPSLD